MISLAKPDFQERFVRVAGLTDRFDPIRIRTDKAVRDALRDALPALCRTRTADEWEAIGVEADVPLLKIRTAEEWLTSDQAAASGAVIELRDQIGRAHV